MTTHRTFLGWDGSRCIQVEEAEDPRVLNFSNQDLQDGVQITSGPFAGFTCKYQVQGLVFEKEGLYASVTPGKIDVDFDRTVANTWEIFLAVPAEQINLFGKALSDTEAEMKRFADRVNDLTLSGEPVKVYCGAGTVPRPGFLNLDIDLNAPKFFFDHRNEYFIFPFVNNRWDIPDNSVDYVFDEDFVEHIPQLMQWQFLAEVLRVLKPGCYHRVNTPNMIASMKRHSRFHEGYTGVYTGEERWGHISILTPFALKEIAETIGYREVIFTTRSCGVSPFAEPDFRPAPDRDDIGGNIFADLRK